MAVGRCLSLSVAVCHWLSLSVAVCRRLSRLARRHCTQMHAVKCSDQQSNHGGRHPCRAASQGDRAVSAVKCCSGFCTAPRSARPCLLPLPCLCRLCRSVRLSPLTPYAAQYLLPSVLQPTPSACPFAGLPSAVLPRHQARPHVALPRRTLPHAPRHAHSPVPGRPAAAAPRRPPDMPTSPTERP